MREIQIIRIAQCSTIESNMFEHVRVEANIFFGHPIFAESSQCSLRFASWRALVGSKQDLHVSREPSADNDVRLEANIDIPQSAAKLGSKQDIHVSREPSADDDV